MTVQDVENEVVVVVDPYSSGRLLVDELRMQNWLVVAVRSSLSTEVIDTGFMRTWNPGPYEEVVVHHGDLDETVRSMSGNGRFRVKAVMAGCEPGVDLADQLCHRLGLRGNEIELSKCRRDKYFMEERIRECGLRSCRQRLVASAKEATAFVTEELEGNFPVVVKPCAGTCADRVFMCQNLAALDAACNHIVNSNKLSEHPDDKLLVQEYLQGTEYMVDCVSLDGRHLVTAIWVHKTVRTAGVFRDGCTKTVPYRDASGHGPQEILCDYVLKCLEALGVRNGASHCEIMLDPERGPCLIEMAARMSHSFGPALAKEFLGAENAQPYLVIDVFTKDGLQTLSRLEAVEQGNKPAYELQKVCTQVTLQCHHGGTLAQDVENSVGPCVSSLPSFHSATYVYDLGMKIEATRDTSTSPGYVILMGPSEEEVDRDAHAIREAEREGKMYIFRKGTQTDLPPADEAHADRPVPLSTTVKLRELEWEVSRVLSPLCKPAGSPKMSPVAAPMPPLADLSLPDAGFDDFDLGEAHFALDGLDGDMFDDASPRRPVDREAGLDDFSLDG
eukprot:TRINITY_DN11451_c0_g1_i1.p1 TRINITY_DN11451_c0_g1~~TRINITY_DN11451_c0_g1_i1.p1  ORF type:complete len:559 (-),score=119.16 TRINITY_DN11451_c0_g1_i1:99-1775(-)